MESHPILKEPINKAIMAKNIPVQIPAITLPVNVGPVDAVFLLFIKTKCATETNGIAIQTKEGF